MARENHVLKVLVETGTVVFSPHGNSMTPKISSGDEVEVRKVDQYLAGDVVYVKVKGTYYLHLLSAVDESKQRFQISNNHGHVNGWVKPDAIFGVCVRVKEKRLLTDEAVSARMEATTEAKEKEKV